MVSKQNLDPVAKVRETVSILRVNSLRIGDKELSDRGNKLATELTEWLLDVRKKYEVPYYRREQPDAQVNSHPSLPTTDIYVSGNGFPLPDNRMGRLQRISDEEKHLP